MKMRDREEEGNERGAREYF